LYYAYCQSIRDRFGQKNNVFVYNPILGFVSVLLTRNSYDEPWEELRKLIRPGMHIKPIIQPRIYIVNNKVGINYRLSELIVQKMPTKRFDAMAIMKPDDSIPSVDEQSPYREEDKFQL
jgi:hypothetical protein